MDTRSVPTCVNEGYESPPVIVGDDARVSVRVEVGIPHQDTLGWPTIRNRTARRDLQSVYSDVVEGHSSVLPGDDCPTLTALRDYGEIERVRAIPPKRDRHAIEWPAFCNRAGPTDVLDVDVSSWIHSQVSPHNEAATLAIRGESWERLLFRCSTHEHAVRGPSRRNRPLMRHTLCIDISARAAIIVPADDRPTIAIGNDGRNELIPHGIGQAQPSFAPSGGNLALASYALRVDVRALVVERVPSDNCSAICVGCEDRREPVSACFHDGSAVARPTRGDSSGVSQPLRVDH